MTFTAKHKHTNMHLSIYSEPIKSMASSQPEHTHIHTPRRPFKNNTIVICHKTWNNVCRHAEIYNGHTSFAHWRICPLLSQLSQSLTESKCSEITRYIISNISHSTKSSHAPRFLRADLFTGESRKADGWISVVMISSGWRWMQRISAFS